MFGRCHVKSGDGGGGLSSRGAKRSQESCPEAVGSDQARGAAGPVRP